jgi:hypothetical protein
MCHVEDNHPCQLLRVCMYGTIYYDTYRNVLLVMPEILNVRFGKKQS